LITEPIQELIPDIFDVVGLGVKLGDPIDDSLNPSVDKGTLYVGGGYDNLADPGLKLRDS
jgi:hypothetical protein